MNITISKYPAKQISKARRWPISALMSVVVLSWSVRAVLLSVSEAVITAPPIQTEYETWSDVVVGIVGICEN